MTEERGGGHAELGWCQAQADSSETHLGLRVKLVRDKTPEQIKNRTAEQDSLGSAGFQQTPVAILVTTSGVLLSLCLLCLIAARFRPPKIKFCITKEATVSSDVSLCPQGSLQNAWTQNEWTCFSNGVWEQGIEGAQWSPSEPRLEPRVQSQPGQQLWEPGSQQVNRQMKRKKRINKMSRFLAIWMRKPRLALQRRQSSSNSFGAPCWCTNNWTQEYLIEEQEKKEFYNIHFANIFLKGGKASALKKS